MTLNIEGKLIGPGERCALIAELSANHDRDLEQALRLVDLAGEAGWDFLKLQTYSAESLTMDSDHPSMAVDPVWGRTNLYELYRDAAMPMEFHKPLVDRARALGMVPFTSVYDPRDLPFTEELGFPIYKIASFEMTYDDLLREIAGTGKPVVMSTGMADLAEVDHAIEVLSRNKSGPVVLLHCVSAYPAPLEDLNLRAMESLAPRCDGLVGFSDHTIGSRAALAAAAMGAVAIEKHITNDPTRPGPDHRFSATSDVLRDIATGVAEIHAARGSGEKATTGAEAGNKSLGRRSAFALRDLPAGHVIAREDFRFVRPGAGIPPNDPTAPVGRTLSAPVRAGHPITYEHLAP
ncbi:N-acetylneuraminate synthase family protein [Roseicyclus sp.]|uniref:N-acetylneuraminate synthase family protein n=1 Tax=Roseicyclus sp. TaxID=1914329 RepID=UPI003F9FDAFF